MKPMQIGSLASGLAIIVLGIVLLLHEDGTIEITGGWLISGLTALAGIALVASGIGARER